MPSFALKIIRPFFSIGSSLAPRITSGIAFALFCLTPSRRPVGVRAEKVHAEGQKRLDATQAMPFPLGKTTVMAYRFNGGVQSSGRRFLVVHGWGSAAAYISALAEGLAAEGDEVVVLDFPGHGRSSGRQLHMRMAVDAIVEAERRFGPFDGAVGHSFGGASLMLAAGGVIQGAGRISPPRLAIIGAPSRIEWLFDAFAAALGLGVKAKQGLIRHAEEIAGARLADFDTVVVARKIRTPLLVVHAEDDKEVDAAHAQRFSAVPTAVIHWANGLGHRRIISDGEVIARIRSFLREGSAESAHTSAA
ncbi:pimeloyl-ACP methyl ester carboxylesterase [Pseudorhizobium tarimense]|uniref:Pimeloyl-ACP methyl ester carboxylesterase n=1 Tax=Pseudorhizobium tarimense TaxID=1079109 RepID=A0ABV2H2U3_9HYPH|nr:alpha/beta hydrolase [Pseudorhizobium tarimense]MCJ8518142.1 alpha/beta hydrolase [Pseudorhizobium tarimense]